MRQATQLFVLQIKQESQFLSNWRMMAIKLFHSNNSSDRRVTQFIKDVCSGGESIAVILSTLFGFGKRFVRRQQFIIETDDTSEILARKLIENLTYNVSTGLCI